MGYGFSLVSCPNYFFETMAWTAIAVMTGSYAGELHASMQAKTRAESGLAVLFLAMATYQMVVWALKKHRNYKKEFGKDYPKGRKAMFPFIL